MTYRLVRPPVDPVAAPQLDPTQQAVVDHDHGPLLVLAGPGTGKTTTLVESVVERVRRGAAPDEVLVLTFSRKAADELRSRIAGRLGRTVVEPAASTFHSFCYSLLRNYGVGPDDTLPRLLSGAERELRVRELLEGDATGVGKTKWPAELAPALRLRGFAKEVCDVLDRAGERGLDPAALRARGREHGRPAWVAAGDFLAEYLEVLSLRNEVDYSGVIDRAIDLLDGAASSVCQKYKAVYVDEYQDTDPSQEAAAATARRGRPTAGGGWRPGPVDLRVPWRGCHGDHRVPRPLPDRGRAARTGHRAAGVPAVRARARRAVAAR